jgi:hypothetical protein
MEKFSFNPRVAQFTRDRIDIEVVFQDKDDVALSQ